jgi:hypothetical protein
MSHLQMVGQTESSHLLKLIFSAQKLTSTSDLLEVARFRGSSSNFGGSEHGLTVRRFTAMDEEADLGDYRHHTERL